MAITWTKSWQAADDGSIIKGIDLKNIQDDITSGTSGDATSIHSVPIVAPTAGANGKVLYYNHSAPAFDYLSVASIIPTGVILLWSGAISAIPSGWVICDGTAGTPNLLDRFVIHADADSGGTNNVGATGGASTVTLTAANLPAHTHSLTMFNANGGGSDGVQESNNGTAGSGTQQTGSIGSGTAHENRPKFYALAYIMKT